MGEESFLGKLYKMVWSRVGGKPFTEVTREEQTKAPLLFMLIFAGLGILLFRFAGRNWWKVLLVFAFGVVVGHIFW